MARRLIFSYVLLSCFILESCNTKHTKDKHYSNLIIKDQKLFALTSDGHINSFDTNTGIIIDANIHTDTPITAIRTDKKGNIIVVKADQTVSTLNQNTLQFKNLSRSNNQIYEIVFDVNNNGYLITAGGIEDMSTQKIHLPGTTWQIRSKAEPSAVFMDKNDNIWLGYGFGEWGGKLLIFNTKTDKFIKQDFTNAFINPVKAIFTDGNNIYVSCGLQHMTLTSGQILKFTDYNLSTVFSSESNWNDNTKSRVTGEYIGPASFNNNDKYIYFYSQHGLFKGDSRGDLSQIKNWEKIASPKLHWTSGQAHAVGYQMNITTMTFAKNGKLFFATQNDGIGVYDGKTFRLLD